MDFSISKDPQALKKEKIVKLTDSALHISKKVHDTYHMLDDAFELYKSSKDLQGFKSVSVQVESSMTDFSNELQQLSKEIGKLDASISKSIDTLESLYTELYKKTKDMQGKVVEFFSKDKADNEKKKELTSFVEKFNVEKHALEVKISKIVDQLS